MAITTVSNSMGGKPDNQRTMKSTISCGFSAALLACTSAPMGGADAAMDPGVCEILHANKGGMGFFSAQTFVIVSALNNSGQALTVRLRAN